MPKVSATADSMAERVGFEPTVPVKVHLISNQARSTELRHLSAGAEASRNPSPRATDRMLHLSIGGPGVIFAAGDRRNDGGVGVWG